VEKIDAYKEILKVLKKHDELLKDDFQIDIKGRLAARITLQEISAEFGIDLKSNCDPGWCKVSEYASIGMYGEGNNRTVSWSDNGEQPENERLYVINFPTGPYIFGGEYPEKTFKAFFDKLKSYGPKYTDTHNKGLYFTSETARHIHKDFSDILATYNCLVDDELKAKKIKSLKAELEKLKD